MSVSIKIQGVEDTLDEENREVGDSLITKNYLISFSSLKF